MINAFYTARSGVQGYQQKLNVTAANLANVSTAGYKERSAGFSELLYTDMGLKKANGNSLLVGNGVRTSDISEDFTQGTLQQTGRTLDVAIKGNGFFALKDEAGNITYTRSGNFQLAERDDGLTLVAPNGSSVLDGSLDEITISDKAEDITFAGSDGNAEEGILTPGVFTFANPYALQRASDGGYIANQNSGEGEEAENPVFLQGVLEQSNVDLGTQMEKLLEAQRGFQMNARMIQTADEMEEIANNLR